jgi:uncharacterized protein
MLTPIALARDDFLRIAAGRRAGTAMETLRAGQDSRRVLRVLAALEAVAPHSPATWRTDEWLTVLDHAAAMPTALRSTLGHPSVGLWALGCSSGTAPGNHLASLAAAAAIRAGLSIDIEIPVHPTGVVLPGIGVLGRDVIAGQDRQSPEVVAVVTRGSAGWEVRFRDRAYPIPMPDLAAPVTGDQRLHAVQNGASGSKSGAWEEPLRLSFAENGLQWVTAIEKADPYLTLPGGRPQVNTGSLPAPFVPNLAEAWRILALRHPVRAADLMSTISLVVPLRREHTDLMVNATCPDAFGAVWLDAEAPPARLAATLVHEVEHALLAALHDVEPLHQPDPAPRHFVPWRETPRPIGALFHGIYAHVAVAEFWLAEAESGQPDAVRQLDRCLANTEDAMRRFTHRDALTAAGTVVARHVSERLASCRNRRNSGFESLTVNT